jgi:hypothetical protein
VVMSSSVGTMVAPMCRSPVGRSPPIPDEIPPDQVKDGYKDRIGKWLCHSCHSSSLFLPLFSL